MSLLEKSLLLVVLYVPPLYLTLCAPSPLGPPFHCTQTFHTYCLLTALPSLACGPSSLEDGVPQAASAGGNCLASTQPRHGCPWLPFTTCRHSLSYSWKMSALPLKVSFLATTFRSSATFRASSSLRFQPPPHFSKPCCRPEGSQHPSITK